MIVTVIWTDCFHIPSNHQTEFVEVRKRSDGEIFNDGIVRQGMRQKGYTDVEIAVAMPCYKLVSITLNMEEHLQVCTVIWTDHHHTHPLMEEITIDMAKVPKTADMIMMAMEKKGYDIKLIQELFSFVNGYNLIGITIGQITWLE